NEQLAWLADENLAENECRVLTNVRCLSEGIDVPALDAVLFLSSRNSQVDVVQSVGRVMRNFRKGQPCEKKYGYIIIPIVVPSDVKPEDALDNNAYFSTVWSILNALRSHDDCFNAEVNKIALNKNKTSKVIVGGPGIGHNALGGDTQDQRDAEQLENAEVARQLELRFGEMQSGIYAKLVEKCGDRLYWENWSKKVGLIARKFIERIAKLVKNVPELKTEFAIFVKGLQQNLNPSVDEGQAIEMLAQHLISQPVFDALFNDYNFVNNNAVSRSMHRMIELLTEVGGFEKDTAELEQFYNSVRVNVGNIDNLEGKQTIIKNLYEKFFKGAFPLTVEKLGIVYTPVECVD
ncbi:helicase-related protein, partial [uncultured Duncaniella sp.]|uniref:helicase-related protein n=1 Tax=uncultured Duncaniella sp. TaxID=2768039 RepID=UPI003455E419